MYTDFVETGKVRFYFLDFPFDEENPAFKAIEASHCAGEQDRYWEMHHELFANPELLAAEDLVTYAETLELDMVAFEACMKKRATAATEEREKALPSRAWPTYPPYRTCAGSQRLFVHRLQTTRIW